LLAGTSNSLSQKAGTGRKISLNFKRRMLMLMMNLLQKIRLLSDIYQSCNVAIIEPAGYEEAAADQHWMVAMKEELMMIEKN
jgi:hypothetical protein